MKNGRKLGLLVAVLVVGVMAAPAFAASVTVGDFVKNVAGAMRLPASDATTAEAALRAAGYSLPRLDRSAVLTEGAVAAIASSVGLNVASSNPAASFSQAQVDRFMTSMGSNLSTTGTKVGAGVSNDPRNETESSRSHSGKGKKKPHSKSPKKPKKPKKPKHPRSDHHHHHHHGRW